MSDLRSHGSSVNADVIDLAEERRRNALYVLGILLRAYVPKNTPDSRELDSALAALASPPIPAGQTLSAQPVASKELSDEQINDLAGKAGLPMSWLRDGKAAAWPELRRFANSVLAASPSDADRKLMEQALAAFEMTLSLPGLGRCDCGEPTCRTVIVDAAIAALRSRLDAIPGEKP